MEPGEVLHRARVLLRDRFFAPAYLSLSPAEAFNDLLADASLSAPRLSPIAHPMLLQDANDLLSGRWRYFGNSIQVDDPPNWQKNYVQSGEWPDALSRELDYRKSNIAGGVKHVWELGRWTWATTLALAYRSTGEEKYKEQCLRWLDDFCAKNPIARGIHHTSGIEDAVRVLGGVIAIVNLDAGADDRVSRALGLIAQQALHSADHLSLGTSANNHLIAEYGAMAAAGAALNWRRDGQKLQEKGVKGLCGEILTQINPDGTSVEQAFGYLPFIWELCLIPLLITRFSLPSDVSARLTSSLEFARVVRLPDGSLPKIGDDDDGRILLPFDTISRLDLVGNLLARFLQAPGLSNSAETLLLADAMMPSDDIRVATALDGEYEFPDGGYTVFRQEGLFVTFDHGPLGWKSIAAHGHADALSIAIFLGAVPLVVDPGVATYQDDSERRDRFRGTSYHSTVNFSTRNQSEVLGPFMWGRRARVEKQDDGWKCEWYTGEVHWRKVEVFDHTITIQDRIAGAHAQSVFVLHPEASLKLDGVRAIASNGNASAHFQSTGLGEWRAEPGEYAPRFSHNMPTIRLCAPFEKNDAVVTIEVKG